MAIHINDTFYIAYGHIYFVTFDSVTI